MINIFENNFLTIGLMLSVCIISYFFVTLSTPFFIRILTKQGSVVEDYHKPGKPKIPRPAGPILFGGIAISLIVLYLFTYSNAVAAILLTTFLAFLVGYVDDKKVMPGWFKPVALIGA
ncbi:MAG: UDP-N-acetylglucosamine-1-phosphate transferase, partial [Nitrososphaeraceae archaeon]|nr:UDP-N-acetylglucosamine-1-phosphate transferase [Nitrososphaeraceae archaeon]